METGFALSEIDSTRPPRAGMHDALPGGKNNHPVGRRLADCAARTRQRGRTGRSCRGSRVPWPATRESGRSSIWAPGVPAARSVHQVAGQTVPGSRVVDAGHDPIVHVYAIELLTGTVGVVSADLREPGATWLTRTLFAGGDMRLDFVGVDPNNPSDDCPAVFVDSETGDFYMQGETVTDPDVLAWINSDSRILDSESVVMLPGAVGVPGVPVRAEVAVAGGGVAEQVPTMTRMERPTAQPAFLRPPPPGREARRRKRSPGNVPVFAAP